MRRPRGEPVLGRYLGRRQELTGRRPVTEVSTIDSRTWLRHTALLAGSNVAAQAILLAGSLAVVVLYTPAEVGAAAAFVSVVGVAGILAAFRYDLALPIVDDDNEARHLLVACTLLVGATSIVVGVIAIVGAPAFVSLLGAPRGLAALRFIVLPAVFLTGAVTVFSQWATRERAYEVIARTKVAEAGGQVTAQVAFGLAGLGASGLALGALVGGGGGAFLLAGRPLAALRVDGLVLDRAVMRAVLGRYRSFPTLSVLSALCQGAATPLLPVFIGALYDVRVAGLVVLAQRVLAAPIRIFGESAARTYFGDVAAMRRRGSSELRRRFRRTMLVLLAVGTVPAIAVAAAGPLLFSVFGATWRPAGDYARPLALLLLAQFVVLPLHHTLLVVERLAVQAALSLLRLILAMGPLVLARHAGASPLVAITAYSVGGFVGYAATLATMDRLAYLD